MRPFFIGLPLSDLHSLIIERLLQIFCSFKESTICIISTFSTVSSLQAHHNTTPARSIHSDLDQ